MAGLAHVLQGCAVTTAPAAQRARGAAAAGPQPAPAGGLSTSTASQHRVGSAQGAAGASATFCSAETGELSLVVVGNVSLSPKKPQQQAACLQNASANLSQTLV